MDRTTLEQMDAIVAQWVKLAGGDVAVQRRRAQLAAQILLGVQCTRAQLLQRAAMAEVLLPGEP